MTPRKKLSTNHPLMLAAIRALDRPWTLWEGEHEKRSRREAKLLSHNDAKREKAGNDYAMYREIAGNLIAENPRLRRATRFRLAQLVQAKLREQGNTVSVRTIQRALGPKK